jgi:hypothetical protein
MGTKLRGSREEQWTNDNARQQLRLLTRGVPVFHEEDGTAKPEKRLTPFGGTGGVVIGLEFVPTVQP